MEEIIKRIIEIEDKAQKIMKDARSDRDGLDKRVEAKEERLKKQMSEAAERRCLKIRESERGRADEEIAQINARTKEQLSALEKTYSENKQKWVDDMVGHIIGA